MPHVWIIEIGQSEPEVIVSLQCNDFTVSIITIFNKLSTNLYF